jgi:metal-responsive CopG/Arc/MetJ family transcriptional regulator
LSYSGDENDAVDPERSPRKGGSIRSRQNRSRNEVFTAALEEYLARHAPDVTEAINRAIAAMGDPHDEFAAAAARRVLEETEW